MYWHTRHVHNSETGSSHHVYVEYKKLHLTLGVTNEKLYGVHKLELFIMVLLKNHKIANTYRTNVIEV